jgi:hypothetical protein
MAFVPVISLPKQTTLVLVPFLLSSVSELQKPSSSGLEHRTRLWGSGLHFCNFLFETNNFRLGTVLLSCLVSKLQELPSKGLKLKTFSWCFDLSKISSWSQGISMQSLVQISVSILKLQVNKHTHTHTPTISILHLRFLFLSLNLDIRLLNT